MFTHNFHLSNSKNVVFELTHVDSFCLTIFDTYVYTYIDRNNTYFVSL